MRIEGARLMEKVLDVGDEQAEGVGGASSSSWAWPTAAEAKDASEAMDGVPSSSASSRSRLSGDGSASSVQLSSLPTFLSEGLGELVAPSALLRLEVLLRLFLAVRPSGDLASTGRTRVGRTGKAAPEASGDRLGLAVC